MRLRFNGYGGYGRGYGETVFTGEPMQIVMPRKGATGLERDVLYVSAMDAENPVEQLDGPATAAAISSDTNVLSLHVGVNRLATLRQNVSQEGKQFTAATGEGGGAIPLTDDQFSQPPQTTEERKFQWSTFGAGIATGVAGTFIFAAIVGAWMQSRRT